MSNSGTHLLPAGRYYIGDPCYVIQDERWDDMLDATNFFQNDKPTVFRGLSVWAASTAFGDGTFMDQNGVEYSVDSGTIGAIPVELMHQPAPEDCTIIDAPKGLSVSCEDGVFLFNNICIDTDPQYDDEEDQEYEDEDEAEEI